MLNQDKKQEILDEFREKGILVAQDRICTKCNHSLHAHAWEDCLDACRKDGCDCFYEPDKEKLVDDKDLDWLSTTLDTVAEEARQAERERVMGKLKQLTAQYAGKTRFIKEDVIHSKAEEELLEHLVQEGYVTYENTSHTGDEYGVLANIYVMKQEDVNDLLTNHE